MSALECADQASPRTCAVKPPHIAALTTKAFFRKCQTRKSAAVCVCTHPPLPAALVCRGIARALCWKKTRRGRPPDCPTNRTSTSQGQNGAGLIFDPPENDDP